MSAVENYVSNEAQGEAVEQPSARMEMIASSDKWVAGEARLIGARALEDIKSRFSSLG